MTAESLVPILPAWPVWVADQQKLALWCDHCRQIHLHEMQAGFHEAPCEDHASPYFATGYTLLIPDTKTLSDRRVAS